MKNIKWNYILVGSLALILALVAALAINRKIEKKILEKMMADGDAMVETTQTPSGQSMTTMKAA